MGSRQLSVATAIEKNRIASDVPFLALLEIDVIDPNSGSLVETLYLARNNEDVLFQGNTYAKASFEFNIKSEAGSTPDVTVDAADYTYEIQSRMDAYGGGVDFPVRILIVNAGNLSQPAELIEEFTVTGASVKSYVVSFKLGAENPLTYRFSRNLQYRDRCPWVYRSEECGYTNGLQTCDYTLEGPNGCVVHQNNTRFGGFPGISTSDY